jgi:mono/diheme cytochrome c family protein
VCGALFSLACSGGAQGRSGILADSAFLPAGIDASELPEPRSAGAQLVARYCSQCHGIPSPASQAAADWPATLRRMLMHMERSRYMPGMGMMMRRGMGMGRMTGMANARLPSDDEQRVILAYLEAHSLRPIAPDSLPEARAAGATLFARTCSRCHALPNPMQHASSEWPAVVARMRGNMLRFRVDTISDATAREITAWLQRTAGRER